MKKKKKIQSRFAFFHHPVFIILSVIVAVILLFIIGTIVEVYVLQQRNLVEDKKTEIKKLPPEIKKQVETASSAASFRVPILLYHYVEYVQDKNDKLRQSLNIPPNILEQQIRTLQDDGYTFMTAGELGEVLDGKRILPLKPVILTFDDGYRDFYTDVFPLLQKYQVKATAYIITGVINQPNYMTSDQIADLAKSNLVELGAHTVHHLWLKDRPSLIQQYEIQQSKSALEQTNHIKVVSFAYPYGAFDKQTIQFVKDAGFTTSVSTIPGIDANQIDRYFLYRIRPGVRTGQILLDFLLQNTFSPW